MTDLGITKLCAEAIGWELSCGGVIFDPLYNDLHAMALVKKFMLDCWFDPGRGSWKAQYSVEAQSENDDLNRAICECVAKMQEAKSGQRDTA